MCLEMMDFDRKDMIMQRIVQNAMQFGMMGMMGVPGAAPSAAGSDQLGGSSAPAESSVTKNARTRTAEATSPT
jgi:hypothetical protein